MHLDLSKLMYGTFQHCRLALPDTLDWLVVLDAALTTSEHISTNHIVLPNHFKAALPKVVIAQVGVPWIVTWWGSTPFPQEARPFIRLASFGIVDLQRLWADKHRNAVRALGYAFHNLPSFLHTPSAFDRAAYEHSFRIAGQFWTELSPQLQHQLCLIMGYSSDDAQRVLAQ